MITANGNNLTFVGDIIRRVLVCRLDAGVERPELREFDQDLIAETKARRGELVRDAQTIMAAYLAVRATAVPLPALGSFGEWSRMVREALVWSGAADPVAVMERTRKAEPKLQALGAVLAEWSRCFGTEPVRAGAVLARHDVALVEALEGIGIGAERKDGLRTIQALGNWLKSVKDRPAGGRVFRARFERTSNQWWVEPVGLLALCRTLQPRQISEASESTASRIISVAEDLQSPIGPTPSDARVAREKSWKDDSRFAAPPTGKPS